MATQTSTTRRRRPSAFLILLIFISVLLIAINVTTALNQSSLNVDTGYRDIYTLNKDAD